MEKLPSTGFFARLGNYFLAGIAITAPLGLTLYLVVALVNGVDWFFYKTLPEEYAQRNHLLLNIPGLGFFLVIAGMTFIGWLTAGFLGRIWISLTESILRRMPIVRGLYGAFKEIIEAMIGKKSKAFRKVVLLEYPRKGVWSLGFLTDETQGETQRLVEDELLNIFIPTTPNPTSGFLIFVPRADVRMLNMSVEEGFKMIMSAGIITPPDRGA